jgi:hypothetical protein
MNWTVIRLVAELCIALWILWQLIRRQQQQDVHEQLVEVRASRDRLRRVVDALPHGGPGGHAGADSALGSARRNADPDATIDAP